MRPSECSTYRNAEWSAAATSRASWPTSMYPSPVKTCICSWNASMQANRAVSQYPTSQTYFCLSTRRRKKYCLTGKSAVPMTRGKRCDSIMTPCVYCRMCSSTIWRMRSRSRCLETRCLNCPLLICSARSAYLIVRARGFYSFMMYLIYFKLFILFIEKFYLFIIFIYFTHTFFR